MARNSQSHRRTLTAFSRFSPMLVRAYCKRASDSQEKKPSSSSLPASILVRICVP